MWYSRRVFSLLAVTSFAWSQGTASLAAAETEFDCLIEPQQVVKLASPVVGVIARLDVDRGDIVREGQILGKLQDEVEIAALALARARATNEYVSKSIETRVGFLQSKHRRLNELYSKAVSSQAALEEAEAEFKIAEQQLKEAELNREIAYLEITRSQEILQQRTLRSPINGVVIERLLVPGEYRNEQTPVLSLAQIDPLRVEVFVPAAFYEQIRAGSKAIIRPEEAIGGVYTATVTVVDRVFDSASGTFGVRLALPNPEFRLPAGIRCKVQFNEALPAADVTEPPTRDISAGLSSIPALPETPPALSPSVKEDNKLSLITSQTSTGEIYSKGGTAQSIVSEPSNEPVAPEVTVSSRVPAGPVDEPEARTTSEVPHNVLPPSAPAFLRPSPALPKSGPALSSRAKQNKSEGTGCRPLGPRWSATSAPCTLGRRSRAGTKT